MKAGQGTKDLPSIVPLNRENLISVMDKGLEPLSLVARRQKPVNAWHAPGS